MRIYQVKKDNQTVGFARSFDQAKAIVKEDNPKASKTGEATESDGWFYSNQMAIFMTEIKPDKDGIITKLNHLLEEKASQPEEPPERLNEWGVDGRAGFAPSQTEETLQPVVSELKTPVGISPAIQFTGNGQGTCLHCQKTVGYVGGFPKVNPPDAIRDQ